MQVDTWMSRRVHTVKPHDTIAHARALMEAHRINQLPVVVEGKLVGIITDRDLRDAFPSVFDSPIEGRRKPKPPGSDPAKIQVEAVMTPHVLTLTSKDNIVEAARMMRRERVGAIPVVDHDRLVGILARSDVLDAFVALAEADPKLSPEGA
ncbi:MAG: CBS domain-containing protein [Deltaproteobacteria bacterium]|nr:CBS domain-containing protein [Deltaproteobacteria bacterium]